uniref:G_PROTEIN_RECEP_F1_2 domain-containing protein n=1 Tax=Caenorhabditis japonica TaxID=281687 RepID=A0A8R1E931_CAEJA
MIGVTVNWTVALLIRKLPSLKNSFGRLTASQSIGDAIHSTLFALYFAPMCFFDVEWMKTYSMVCGHLLLIAYDISTYSHFCISVNRFCSIVAPVRYDSIFSMSNTRKLIMFSWTMAILPSIYLYIFSEFWPAGKH